MVDRKVLADNNIIRVNKETRQKIKGVESEWQGRAVKWLATASRKVKAAFTATYASPAFAHPRRLSTPILILEAEQEAIITPSSIMSCYYQGELFRRRLSCPRGMVGSVLPFLRKHTIMYLAPLEDLVPKQKKHAQFRTWVPTLRSESLHVLSDITVTGGGGRQ